MSIANLASNYIQQGQTGNAQDNNDVADIIKFAEAPWGLNMCKATGGSTELRPVQKFVLKCYYNIPLDDTIKNIIVRDHLNEVERYRFTEKEYLNYLYNEGRCNVKEITDQIRNELVLVAGRRGGKSKISAIVSAYETYKLVRKNHPQKYFGITDNAEIYITVVATATDQAELLFNDIAGFIANSRFFDRYKNDPTVAFMKIRTPYDLQKGPDSKPSVIIQASACSARSLRGPSNIVIVMDEQAHFIDSSSNKSDAAVYDAITPSTLSFGKEARIINISSPLNKQGKLYELYKQSFQSEKLLMFQIPTWELWPEIDASELREKFRRNAAVFWCELGAQFSDTVKSWMSVDQLIKCIEPTLAPKLRGNPRTEYFMGVDIGLKQDTTAISVVHIEPVRKNLYNANGDVIDEIIVPKYELDRQHVLTAPEGQFLDFDSIADEIEMIAKDFEIKQGLFDQYNGVPLMQSLKKKGFNQFEMVYFDRRFNSEIYNNFLLAVIDEKVRIFDDHEGTQVEEGKYGPFITEIIELQAQMISKYITLVAAPPIEGKHDDRSDSFVRALWCATQRLTDNVSQFTQQAVASAVATHTANTLQHHQMMKRQNRYYNERRALRQNSPYSVFYGKKGR